MVKKENTAIVFYLDKKTQDKIRAEASRVGLTMAAFCRMAVMKKLILKENQMEVAQ